MSEDKNQQQKSQEQIFWEGLTQSQRTLVIIGVTVVVLAIIVVFAIIIIKYFSNPNRHADEEEALLVIRNVIPNLFA